MQSHSDVELILAAEFDQVLVAANAACFQGLRAELFIFIRNEMNAQGKFIDVGLLSAQIEDTDLCVWNTAAEARFRVRLIFAITITVSRPR